MKKSFSRGTALVAGTAMLLINGVVYAWSIYSSPFVEGFGWSSAKLGVCFTVMLGSFCLGGVIGGAVANWKGVRVSVPAGGVLGFVGYLLCMFLQADRLWLLFIAFAIAGIGVIGMGIALPFTLETYSITRKECRAIPVSDFVCLLGGLCLRYCLITCGAH